jgi:hypothetical protein
MTTVHPTDRPLSAIDALLGDAYDSTGIDEDYSPTNTERIARAAREDQDAVANTDAWILGMGGRCEQLAHEQLAHELDLACTLVLTAANAAPTLSRLVNDQRIDPEGALVFGCLLHLTGHAEACRFWWQFAAGGASHTAAYCLYLYHGRYAEFRDANYWRRQAATLRTAGRGAKPPQPISLQGSLLPEHVLRDILAQCHRGDKPRLPPPLETLINRLRVDSDDEDFGEIPQPSPYLACALVARA